MSTEENQLEGRRCCEEILHTGNLSGSDERGSTSEDEARDRKIFGLALAIATEPSKLGQLRLLLVQLQEQSGLPLDISTWALGQLDERVKSMALEYAHDAEALLQILSFKGGTFASLLQDIENLYRQEKISQRVYARAKLLLRVNEPSQPE